ncbi:hypothetical protein ACGF4C_00620 [Streptomyces sp. NPDC048197]|uniref:hypothetical protein n=1 Tax=Streptomyces sp. NPDC048197 TaxID=3365511 RepID=UPI003719D7FB
MDEDCWDDVAIRDITAVVLYSLHLRDGLPVDKVPWTKVLWHLWDDARVSALVNDVLPGAGHDLTLQADPDDPVAERWRWLTRTWDPSAPIRPRNRSADLFGAFPRRGSGALDAAVPEPRWGGMSRGVGSALPDPALEVCTNWSAVVVQAAIIAQQGGYPKFTRVRVTDGEFKGHRGYVVQSGWVADDDTQTMVGPEGYVVDLDDSDDAEEIDADQLKRSYDHRWPRRPAGTVKDGPPPRLHDPLPPRPTCAEDLADILERASNPEAVPDDLRGTIASAKDHHHLQMDWQASPEPQRFTWQVIMHWYQLTEHYSDDQRAELWEIVLKTHLHDPEPTRHLALREEDVPLVIARCTAATA